MGMEGAHGWPQWGRLAASNFFRKFEPVPDSLLHLHGGFIGKRYSQDAVGPNSVPDQIGNSESNHAGFSRTRTSQYEERAGESIDCVLLRWV